MGANGKWVECNLCNGEGSKFNEYDEFSECSQCEGYGEIWIDLSGDELPEASG